MGRDHKKDSLCEKCIRAKNICTRNLKACTADIDTLNVRNINTTRMSVHKLKCNKPPVFNRYTGPGSEFVRSTLFPGQEVYNIDTGFVRAVYVGATSAFVTRPFPSNVIANNIIGLWNQGNISVNFTNNTDLARALQFETKFMLLAPTDLGTAFTRLIGRNQIYTNEQYQLAANPNNEPNSKVGHIISKRATTATDPIGTATLTAPILPPTEFQVKAAAALAGIVAGGDISDGVDFFGSAVVSAIQDRGLISPEARLLDGPLGGKWPTLSSLAHPQHFSALLVHGVTYNIVSDLGLTVNGTDAEALNGNNANGIVDYFGGL